MLAVNVLSGHIACKSGTRTCNSLQKGALAGQFWAMVLQSSPASALPMTALDRVVNPVGVAPPAALLWPGLGGGTSSPNTPARTRTLMQHVRIHCAAACMPTIQPNTQTTNTLPKSMGMMRARGTNTLNTPARTCKNCKNLQEPARTSHGGSRNALCTYMSTTLP